MLLFASCLVVIHAGCRDLVCTLAMQDEDPADQVVDLVQVQVCATLYITINLSCTCSHAPIIPLWCVFAPIDNAARHCVCVIRVRVSWAMSAFCVARVRVWAASVFCITHVRIWSTRERAWWQVTLQRMAALGHELGIAHFHRALMQRHAVQAAKVPVARLMYSKRARTYNE
eukprot:1191010-Prorocentrum_minimum.AAC.1